jgi:rhodanese-related sulfurtransferase
VRRAMIPAMAAAMVLIGAAPASPPDSPVNFIKVDELKAALDRGEKADLIDVRNWDAYVEMHIKGARSMPLRVIEARAPKEISKTGIVVFY